MGGHTVSAGDGGRFVASGRQHCLLIIAVGFLSAQMACLESERRIMYSSFAYIEKALAVAAAIGEMDGQAQAPEAAAENLQQVPVAQEWRELLVQLTGTKSIRRVVLTNAPERLQTRADPMGECKAAIYQFGSPNGGTPNRWQIEVGDIANEFIGAVAFTGSPERTFAVSVSGTCPGPFYDYVIVEYRKREYGIMFHEAIYELLEHGIYGSAGTRLDLQRVGFSEGAPLSSFRRQGETRNLLKAIELSALKGLVLRRAMAVDGRTYRLSQLDDAIRVILEGGGGGDFAAELWGVRVAARTAVPIVPGIFLGLAISLLYRTKRIEPEEQALKEPWIALKPSGVVEKAAATAWLIGMFGATLAVTWVVLVYEGEDLGRVGALWWTWPVASSEERWGGLGAFVGTSVFWGLAANVVSGSVLLRACRHVCDFNRAKRKASPRAFVTGPIP